uniref:substrate-binding domain-containing protein n=1 Tax=Pseudoxanthobacter sp. TaxID=1925742 RepID=UPI002FE0156B
AGKLPAMIYADFKTMGGMTGKALVENLNGESAEVVTFPGPAGSGWAESFNDGFKEALTGSKVKVLGEKFGDTGVAIQLQLIQDALQAYPNMNVIWGSAPTAEAAIGAVAEAGKQGEIKIISSYENQALLDALNRGDIMGFATQFPVLEGRVAMDQTVRVLEKKPVMPFVKPIPVMISEANAKDVNMSLVLAPADWKPVYSVKP